LRFIGCYRVFEKVGSGGMGDVYRAGDTRNGEVVAVKVLLDARLGDERMVSRFRREARIEAALQHPNIAAFRDFGEAEVADGGRSRRVVYLVMEWVPGEDLGELLKRRGRLPAREALALGLQVAAALEAAHRLGVVHRDLKPGNIRLTPEGRVKVLDFGLAKILAGTFLGRRHPVTFQTSVGSVLGTAPYMAPEQLLGRPVEPRTDLFALGVVLYRMTTGQVPFGGRNVIEAIQAVSRQAPEPPSSLDPGLGKGFDDLVLRLLAKEPTGRPASAREAAQAMEALLATEAPG
jgi:serine/threonine protein kinase